ncbi:GDSL-like Lipase/Acylhydrolase family protein [Chitinophaga eiseniae]|uniref:GDSL-like Lipase/Acylhydrolase family protein n=1 Tax=Chitinophaga eiseniae TaxID=634771 RepID=A0A1T4STF7_9BACT|nr:GDSL-type esterase/lipase family protein [Chitinophaga eiseniae]SKA31158.1 GDSL-like Lipase/Acylhydrolase family protein [Chitinophaga eiseniae]
MNHRYLLLCCLMACMACASRTYTVINKGVAGNSTADLLARVEKDVVALQPDLVVLMAGTNDMVNSHKLVPYGQYAAQYRQLVRRIRQAGARVVLMTSLPVDTGYLFQRHQRGLYDTDPNRKIDSACAIVREIAVSEQVYCFDLHEVFVRHGEPDRAAASLIINAANTGREDGIHPTAAGYRLMAAQLYAYLKKHHLLRRHHRILCFGDSITYGAFMDGAGTDTGDTYPAALKRLLNH